MTDLAILRAIERLDPDGGDRRPTDADYAEFERWAIATYGEGAWTAYNTPGWGEDRGPDYYGDDY